MILNQIAREAIAIADAEGFGSVTMQRLAKQLGFRTLALYRYVAAKSDPIALMVEHTEEEMPERSETARDWRASLAGCAHRLLDGLEYYVQSRKADRCEDSHGSHSSCR